MIAAIALGTVHGHAGKGRSTVDKAYGAFEDENVDAILFGHSHIPYRVRVDGTRISAAHRFYLSKG